MKNCLFLIIAAFLGCIQWAGAQQPAIQYYRPWNQDGINVFEPSKKAPQPDYTGFKIRIGGSFTQDFQYLEHSNNPRVYDPVTVSGSTRKVNRMLLYGVPRAGQDANQPASVTNDPKLDTSSAQLNGFNLAMANLNLDFQIADGIRVALENYMSSRHHSEFWVKGGYIQIDKLPMFNNPSWYTNYFRVKIGHFQPNFGDMQFRRTDGGTTIFNPFVENYILDAFSTEIGGEVYAFPTSNLMAMVGVTNGFINGNVENFTDANNRFGVVATKKTPSIFAKLAFDDTLATDLRVRLSGSVYHNPNSARNTLYAGDRTGSHYFLVMEPAYQASGAATSQGAQFTSGRFNPSFSNRVTAVMINPFVKFKGLEVFGSYEIAQGGLYSDTLARGASPTWEKRKFNQWSVEGVYRFLPNKQLFVGARYVSLTGEPDGANFKNPDGSRKEISITRLAFSAGWFPTKNLLLKGEYVMQEYKDFPVNDYRTSGKFSGFMIEAVVGF